MAKAVDGTIISKQDTQLSNYSASPATTKIMYATFGSSDSSKIAFVTSEGSMQSLFGGHLVILSMLSKSIEKIYKESMLSTGGVSFNTNDSMVATGNKNGDVLLRNVLHPEGDPINQGLDLN